MAKMYTHKDALKHGSQTAWAATTAKIIGDMIKPTTGLFYLYCTGAGITGGVEPVWGTPSYLDPFGDGTVVWEVRGTGEFDAINPDRAAFEIHETLGNAGQVNGIIAGDNVLMLQGSSGEYATTEALKTVNRIFCSSASLVDGGPGEYHAIINLAGHSADGFATVTTGSYVQRVLLKNGGSRGFDLGFNDSISLTDCVVLDCVGRPVWSSNGNLLKLDGFYTIGCTEGVAVFSSTQAVTITNSFIKVANGASFTIAALESNYCHIENSIILANGAAAAATFTAAISLSSVNFPVTIKKCIIGFYGTPLNASSDLFGVRTTRSSQLYPAVITDCHFENIRNTDGAKVGKLVGSPGAGHWTAVQNCTGNNCDDIDDQSGLTTPPIFWDVTAFDQGFEDPDNDDWTPTNDPTSYPFQKAIALEPDWMGTSPAPFGIGGGGGGVSSIFGSIR